MNGLPRVTTEFIVAYVKQLAAERTEKEPSDFNVIHHEQEKETRAEVGSRRGLEE